MEYLKEKLTRFSQQAFYKNMSYGMKMKLEELIKRKHAFSKSKQEYNIALIIFGMTLVFIMFNINSYFNFLNAKFSSKASLGPRLLDICLLLAAVLAGISFFVFSGWRRKAEESFETIRKSIMSNYEKEFCNCKAGCSCKDDVMKYLHKIEGINLSY